MVTVLTALAKGQSDPVNSGSWVEDTGTASLLISIVEFEFGEKIFQRTQKTRRINFVIIGGRELYGNAQIVMIHLNIN